MKKRLLTYIPLLILFFFGNIANAAWFEVTGSATIVASQNEARIHALEDALYQAMKYAGADIGSLSGLLPFLEEDKQEYQFTNHEVRYLRVVDKVIIDNRIQVRIRVDIYPSATGCQVGQYKKTFLVGNINLAHPAQAVMGQIYKIGDDFSHVLNQQLDIESVSFISVGTTDYMIDKNQPEMLKMIAEDNNAQYIIGGTITDLSATIEQKLLADDVVNRQFALEMQVYDGKTGHEIYSRNYREIAHWPFPKTSQVDTRSARFWDSSYGEMLLRVSRKIMLDLEAELSCKITLPQIIAKHGNNLVTIDLGRIHGVEVGDRLRLWHTGAFIDQYGLPRNKVSQSEITLTITRTYDQESEASIDQPQLAQSIQIGDVMHKEMQ
ncbi:flagellar basal-body protein [Vibrio sp. HA2012]|uniref:flagellar assembly protein FlgT n=1 Tax=Vibrio sp. HA2012 TaxID=1971595 RepID=UPI000C2BE9B9|nr:flagellar assembly protein FlgT [Vibrio sp. HA2012]PJC86008.1 flagellar basal-body protein [Vibrio sp. HA2012]